MAWAIRGQAGELRHGYKVVARLGPWTLDGGRMHATARDVDEMWIDAPSLELRLAVGRQDWIWRGVVVENHGAELAATINGSPERRDAR